MQIRDNRSRFAAQKFPVTRRTTCSRFDTKASNSGLRISSRRVDLQYWHDNTACRFRQLWPLARWTDGGNLSFYKSFSCFPLMRLGTGSKQVHHTRLLDKMLKNLRLKQGYPVSGAVLVFQDSFTITLKIGFKDLANKLSSVRLAGVARMWTSPSQMFLKTEWLLLTVTPNFDSDILFSMVEPFIFQILSQSNSHMSNKKSDIYIYINVLITVI